MTDKLKLPSSSEIQKVLRFDNKKLPSFPQVAAKLLELSGDDTISMTDLSRIVETDPGISTRVLEIVNSAMYGLRQKVTALSEAVVLIGMDEIKKLALGMTVFQKMFKTGRAESFDRLLFWRHSISVAVLSMKIAKETGYPNPEEAYTAGLLHDTGKIFLDLQGRRDYGELIQALSHTTDPVIEKEISIMGLGHDDIGAFYARLWKLPERLVLAIKYHHQPFEHLDLTKEESSLISIVSLANFLCWTQGIGSFDMIRPPVLSPEIEKRIDPDKIDIIGCLHHMNKEIEAISEFYHFIFPTAAQLRENLLQGNLLLSKINTRYYYQSPGVTLRDMMPEKTQDSTAEVDFAIGKSLARARTIKEILDIVMYQVGCIFNPLDWSILLKDPKTGHMTFSVVVGANREKLQGVRLPEGEGIAGHIMKTGEALVIPDVGKDKRFSIRVDKYTGFKTRSVIGTPLKADKKIFGVIELINRIDEDGFTDDDLTILSSIAEYAAIAIESCYYHQTLKKMATKDSLTGLKNRWSFERAVRSDKDILKQYGSVFAMLIIEIAGFHKINEARGRNGGDEFLKKTARVLTRTLRPQDDIFRYGEDTFVVLMPRTYADETELARKRILDALQKTINETDKSLIEFRFFPHTVSAGESKNLMTLLNTSLLKALTKEKPPVKEDEVADIESNLQPMVEAESEQEAHETDKTQTQGRAVSLPGKFVRLKTKTSGLIRVEKLTLLSIGFRIKGSHKLLINEFLDIQFTLDNAKKSLVERRAIVRAVSGDYVDVDFYNPPPYAKDLGFYLISGA